MPEDLYWWWLVARPVVSLRHNLWMALLGHSLHNIVFSVREVILLSRFEYELAFEELWNFVFCILVQVIFTVQLGYEDIYTL